MTQFRTLILVILIAGIGLADAGRTHTSDNRRKSLSSRQRDDDRYFGTDEINADPRSLRGFESIENSSSDTFSDAATSTASQQAVLCDIATSIPALTSLKSNAWSCPSVGTNITYCSWQGVTCDSAKNIVGLSILSASTGAPLRSSIPASLGTLVTLKSLSIKQCSVRGTIPPSISSLTNLTQLILSSNFLTGTLPDGLSSLVFLQTLYLDNNTLGGTFPTGIASLSNLLYLDISLNKFYGKFPTFYGMPVVTAKTLTADNYDSSNSIKSGIIGSRIHSDMVYPELTRDNSIVDKVEQFVPNSEFVYDDRSDNGFSDEYVMNDKSGFVYGYDTEINENEKRSRLEIEKNDFESTYEDGEIEEGREEGREGRELKSLQSYYSPPAYYIPIYQNSHGLKYLSLYANFFTGTIPSGIAGISSLKELHISYNSLTGTIPSSLGNILSLQLCSLQWNSFSGQIPSSFGLLKNLQTLKLFTNR